MKNKISDKEVLQVLTGIKNSETTYPQGMIESRRGAFMKQAAAMAVLMKAGVNGANATGTGQVAATASTTSGSAATAGAGASIGTILETVLVVAIVIETGVAAYAYREKIAEFINSIFGPKVEQVASPPDNSSPVLITSTSIEPTSETPSETPTVTETPPPPGFTPPAQADNNNASGTTGNTQVASTPVPDDDNGLHLGQTKQPTKQPKKNESNDSKDKDKKK